jgi:hypothetical protein|tara:strand:- start:567 stop:731 length:165 start_codon:yes stop_codon:yes gene_type:complete
MIEITEKELNERKDYYEDKVESGTVVLVKKPNGAKVMMVPQDPSAMDYQRQNDI